ncbi:hypothetical protein K501DRAFT_260418 [Backusella circina FSU 941]|nr:hypothetical protein K501DRAFT_260418 [Backusella circina FSU 941]
MAKGNKKTTTTKKPKVIIRTYQASDLEAVQRLHGTATTELIPESIRSKLWAPLTWLVWFAVYSAILLIIPRLITMLQVEEWVINFTKVFLSFLWAAVGFAMILIASQRVETIDRIEEANANDLADPELFYLNYYYNNNGEKERKPQKEQVASHFWVLTLDDEVCGMVGLTSNKHDIDDQRDEVLVGWKCILASFFEIARIPLQLKTYNTKSAKSVFIRKQIPNTATVTRWTVHPELLNHGFSTLLMNRVLTWSNEHGIDRVYADTNECCMAAEQIMTRRHGFTLMKRSNIGLFGQYKKLYVCNVPEWISVYGEKSRAGFKKSS